MENNCTVLFYSGRKDSLLFSLRVSFFMKQIVLKVDGQ